MKNHKRVFDALLGSTLDAWVLYMVSDHEAEICFLFGEKLVGFAVEDEADMDRREKAWSFTIALSYPHAPRLS